MLTKGRSHYGKAAVLPALVLICLAGNAHAGEPLKPGGKWLVQSDHEAYFEMIYERLGQCSALTEIPWHETGVGPGPDWEGTNFEVKYVRDGRSIFRSAYVVCPT